MALFFSLLMLLVPTISLAQNCGPILEGRGPADAPPFSQVRTHPRIRGLYQQIGDDTYLARSVRNEVIVYNYRRQQEIRRMDIRNTPRIVLGASDGSVGVNATEDSIEIFDIPTGQRRAFLAFRTRVSGQPRSQTGYAQGIITRDNQKAVLIGHYGDFVVVDLKTNSIEWAAPSSTTFQFFWGLRESPDGKYILGNRWENKSLLYERRQKSGREFGPGIAPPFRHLYSAEFAPDSKSIIYSSLEKRLVRYHILDGTYSEIEGPWDWIGGIHTSPDHRYLIAQRIIGPQSPAIDRRAYYIIDLTTMQEREVASPDLNNREYVSFKVSMTRNALRMIDHNKMFVLNFASWRLSRYDFPAGIVMPAATDFTRDGQSFFDAPTGPSPIIKEIY